MPWGPSAGYCLPRDKRGVQPCHLVPDAPWSENRQRRAIVPRPYLSRAPLQCDKMTRIRWAIVDRFYRAFWNHPELNLPLHPEGPQDCLVCDEDGWLRSREERSTLTITLSFSDEGSRDSMYRDSLDELRYTALASWGGLLRLGSRVYTIHVDSLGFPHSGNGPFAHHYSTVLPFYLSKAMEIVFRSEQYQDHPLAREGPGEGAHCAVEFALERIDGVRSESSLNRPLGRPRPLFANRDDVHQILHPATFGRIWGGP